MIFVTILLALVGIGIYRSYRHNSSAQTAAKQHLPAPDFTLQQLNGQPLQLSSFRGKVVMLDFWATWCVPCREEIPHFVVLQEKYGSQGLQIIGVSMDDTRDPVPGFYRELHMNYPVVMGNAEVGSKYGGVLGLPITFLIDRDGQIFSKHIGATDAAVFEKEIMQLLQKK